MKPLSNFVSLHPYFKAHPGKLEALKAGLPAFVEPPSAKTLRRAREDGEGRAAFVPQLRDYGVPGKRAEEEENPFYEFTVNGDALGPVDQSLQTKDDTGDDSDDERQADLDVGDDGTGVGRLIRYRDEQDRGPQERSCNDRFQPATISHRPRRAEIAISSKRRRLR